MHRFALLTAVALAAVLGLSACGSSDDGSSTQTVTASPAASKQPASGKLDPSDAQILTGASQTVADYCNGHKATSGELTGAVATLESLIQVDPDSTNASGQTVKQVSAQLAQKLKDCGANAASKRLKAASG